MACNAMAQQRAVHFFGALLTALLCAWTSAGAAGLTISPVMIELDSPRRAVAITLSNGGDTTLTFQSRAVVWQQTEGGDRYSPTDALLVAPAIIEIPPQSSQVFRVVLRSTDALPIEQSFRLLLEDVSRPESGDGKPAVALRLIHSLPLFVAPSGKTLWDLRWSACAPEGQSNCLRISNAGNRHVKVRSVTIRGERWERQLDVSGTLLAGAWREWRFDRPAGDPAITAIAVQNDREMLMARRDDRRSPQDTPTIAASENPSAACTPEAIEAILYAQASAQAPGMPAADRIADDVRACADGSGSGPR